MVNELDERRGQILFAVVAQYIATGKAVSSRSIAKRYTLKLSPASIRNVLADLEDAEFLHQPHTSAGRLPTEAGFRYFVDTIATAAEISDEHRIAFTRRLSELGPRDDVVRETGQLLSHLTQTAAIIARSVVIESNLDQLHFIWLSKGRMLAVLITRCGAVEHRIVAPEVEVDHRTLERINNYLAELVGGRTLPSVRDLLAERLATEKPQYQLLREHAQQIIEATVQSQSTQTTVVIEGQGTLFDRPEFGDAKKIRRYLSAFEDKQKLLELLEQTLLSDCVQVFIGSEAALDDVHDISVITSPYRHAGTRVGSFGIVGPTRMDYQQYVPLVGFAANVLSDALDGRLPGMSEGS